MLWFVCLFNYADRQAIFSVFPLLRTEMGLSNEELGIVGGAFMWVYAAALPLAGMLGDRLPRKTLILGGLIFWSLITLATALSQKYWHLVFFRALEGFGEAFYFPASMSLISDYHGPGTRSRAMSFHQSSVYAGTILGGTVAGYCAQYYGWRSGFNLFGSLGLLLGIVLIFFLREPERGQADPVKGKIPEPVLAPKAASPDLSSAMQKIMGTPMVVILIAVFVGANFVASIFLTWMPSFLHDKFGMSLSMAGLNSTMWSQIASMLGVVVGGILADRWARDWRGGRMMAQSIGLFAGVPFIFLTGWTISVPVLIFAMIGFGFFKGIYDANIWASLYDVVETKHRATALGLMNSIGWLGAGVAPVAIAVASRQFAMGACISANSVIYLCFGCLLIYGVISRFPRSKKMSAVAADVSRL
jgi:MFS family permease